MPTREARGRSGALIERLAAAIGERHVRTDPDALAPHLIDERRRYRGAALAVASPGGTAEVAEVVRLCGAAGVAVVAQGGNTGLCGGATPLREAPSVVLSLRRMRRVRGLDRLGRTITVESGATVAETAAAAAESGLLFPLSFGAEGSAQIGGALSTNAGGTNVLRYGNARALTLGLEVVLADGSVARLGGGLRKDNTGYDLKHLFVGSEGTLGVICEATLALFPLPRRRVTAMATLQGAAEALELMGRLDAAADGRLSACEWLSPTTRALACTPPGRARDPFGGGPESLLLVELTSGRDGEGLRDLLEEVLGDSLRAGIIDDATVADGSAAAGRLWQVRTAPSEVERLMGGTLKYDIAVVAARIPEFLEAAGAAARAVLAGVRVSAFGHLGDGNIHFNLLAPPDSPPHVLDDHENRFTAAVFDIAESLGGTFSAEHGIGQRWRGELANRKHPVALDLMRRLKATLDPQGVLNPGKVI